MPNEVASLTLQVKSDQVEKGATRLAKLDREAEGASTSQRKLATSTKVAGAATAKTSTATAGYTATTKAATTATKGFGLALKSAILPASLLLAPLLALTQVVSITADLEFALSGVKAVTQATATEMAGLESVARDLGATTVFSATQAAEGMAFLGRAGFETNEIISAMPGLLDLAAAGQLELAAAADIASNVLSGFRLEASESGRVADVLAKGAASANTNVKQLGDALSYTAPLAASLGIELEDVAAAIGILSDNGIQGERAGTGLRTVLASLSKITPIAATALEDLGLTVADVNPQVESLENILQKLSDAGLDAKAAFKIFGTEGATAALALTSQVSSFSRLAVSLRDAEGSAEDMAKVLSNNLQGSYKKLGSAASEFAIQLDDTIGASDLWRDAIDQITVSVGKLSSSLKGAGASDVKTINQLVETYDNFSLRLASDTVSSSSIFRITEDAKDALSAFSQVEIALARAENQLDSLTTPATRTTLKQRPLENPLLFALRQREQAEKDLAVQQAAAASASGISTAHSIAAKKEEIVLLRELLTAEQALEAQASTASGGSEVFGPFQLNDEEQSAAQVKADALIAIERDAAAERLAIAEDLASAKELVQQQALSASVSLAGQLENLAEEGSSAQKVLFGVEKALAFAQTIVNANVAYGNALAIPGAGIAIAETTRALGYASAAVIAGTTIGSFAGGGVIPGTSFSGDSLTANVNSGEMVLNNSQQAQLFNMANGQTSTGTGAPVNITVENYGSSQISVEQLSESDIRIIARDVSKQVVQQDSPGIIAADIRNPNGAVSKSMGAHTKTERKR